MRNREYVNIHFKVNLTSNKFMKFDILKTITCYPIKNAVMANQNINDCVIEEKLLTLQIKAIGSFTFLCTPNELIELGIGFIFTEGIINAMTDVTAISDKYLDGLIISLEVKNPDVVNTKRNLIVTSGCGLCGKHNIDNLLSVIEKCSKTLNFPLSQLGSLNNKISKEQVLFKKTGATHVACIFDVEGKIIAISEDIGRHNALDKTIGKCIMHNLPLRGCGVFLSSRISFEMVIKAARAGIELIIAVSAPTALAIKAAEYWNITLCGFMRNNNGNIYSHPERFI